jgi:ribosome-associated translation inhibitor RaiA
MNNKNNKFKINFENVDHSMYLIDYIKRKIQTPKFSKLKVSADNISIKKDHQTGSSKFILTASITIHKTKLFFKEIGDNIYSLIDAIVRKINQKVAKQRSIRGIRSQISLKYML